MRWKLQRQYRTIQIGRYLHPQSYTIGEAILLNILPMNIFTRFHIRTFNRTWPSFVMKVCRFIVVKLITFHVLIQCLPKMIQATQFIWCLNSDRHLKYRTIFDRIEIIARRTVQTLDLYVIYYVDQEKRKPADRLLNLHKIFYRILCVLSPPCFGRVMTNLLAKFENSTKFLANVFRATI